ncbi:MAG TPA: class I SAM-dependent methyltransferase [Terriglobia bacterium]|nr:class I SAM-dependent methyltransferase [Terriglobia bacterium]
MTAADNVRVEDVPACLLCGKKGVSYYEALRDRLFSAPGVWNFLKCPGCGLIWLNPRPVPEDNGKVYSTYYTHSDNGGSSKLATLREKIELSVLASLPGYQALAPSRAWRQIGRILRLIPPIMEQAWFGPLCLDGLEKGKLLDIGCGNGNFLAIMRDAGWEVMGVDPDPASAKIAKERFGLQTIVGTIWDARLPEKSFDAVTLNHVIEHVYDPIALFRECRRVLKPDGRLVVVTPNVESMAHQVFRAYWRELDPPRHLHLFSFQTLQDCAAESGLHIKILRTSSHSARGVWVASQAIKNKGRFSLPDATVRLRINALAFQVREEVALRTSGSAGEELILVGSRTT